MNAADFDDLLSRLKEIEELLLFPAVEGHLKRAESLALSIARKAPSGGVANLAMQLINETLALRPGRPAPKADDAKLNGALGKLREALTEAKRKGDLLPD